MTNKRYSFAPPVGLQQINGKQGVPGEVRRGGEHSIDIYDNINKRIHAYQKEGLSCEMAICDEEDLTTVALTMDPYLDHLPALIRVEETGAQLTDPKELEEAHIYFKGKEHIPSIWAAYLATGDYPPFLFEHTSFINYFGEKEVVLIDLYRPPWKPYYTSDVFFSQWLRVLGEEEKVQYLPDTFPETFYINNVTNIDTIKELEKMLREADEDVCIKQPGEIRNWALLKNTPHLKCVLNILKDFNQIKALDGRTGYGINTVQCYRQDTVYNLKMKIGRE
ncbi:MAG: hypothetical protein AAFX87_25415 [Bacteroidota bacterium]